MSVAPLAESDVVGEKQILIDQYELATGTWDDGTVASVTHAGEYVVIRFTDRDGNHEGEPVVYRIADLIEAAADHAGLDLDNESD